MIELAASAVVVPPAVGAGVGARVVTPDQPLLALAARRRAAAERVATERLGWQVSYGARATAPRGRRLASIAERAADVNEAFADPEVGMVICSSGGGSTREVLTGLDYELIRHHPKALVGQCANVALSLGLLAQAGLASFLGPCFANHLGDLPAPFDETVEALEAALAATGELEVRPVGPRAITSRHGEPVAARERTMAGGWRWLRPGVVSGPLVGGDVGTLLTLLHGPYFPAVDGCVLLLDPNALPVEVLDLALAELHDAGVLTRAAGVLFAERRKVDAVEDPDGDLADLVDKWFPGDDVPVLAGGDCGHIDPVWTLAIGAPLRMDSTADRLAMDLTR